MDRSSRQKINKAMEILSDTTVRLGIFRTLHQKQNKTEHILFPTVCIYHNVLGPIIPPSEHLGKRMSFSHILCAT